MTLTINIISFHYGHLAAQAVESILGQTASLRGVTLRVFDDGVGDCGHLQHIYPDVEIIQRPVNLGQVGSIQDAVARATTDRCLNLGADNWLRPDTLERLLRRSEDIVSYDICVTGEIAAPFARRVGATLQPSGYHVWNFTPGDIQKSNYIHGSSMFTSEMAKRYTYRHIGGRGPAAEDWMMWRDMLGGGATHHHIREPMLYYRRHRQNLNRYDNEPLPTYGWETRPPEPPR